MKKAKIFALSLVLCLQLFAIPANAKERCGCSVMLDGTASVSYTFIKGDKHASGQTYVNGKPNGQPWSVLVSDVPCQVTCKEVN